MEINKMNVHNISPKLILFASIIILLQTVYVPKTALARTGREYISGYQAIGNRAGDNEINPMPVIQSLIPDQINSGGADFILQVQGQGFISSTVVSWNNILKPTAYISSTLVTATIYSSDIFFPGEIEVFVNNPPPDGGDSNKLTFKINPNLTYIPIVFCYFPSVPAIPVLSPIDNSSLNNMYSVNWDSARFAEAYRLQEATDPDFTSVTNVFDGVGYSWSTPYPGKAPGTYYYRVQSYTSYRQSDWSPPQSVMVYPPYTPSLFLIDNSDQNNVYSVSWGTAVFATAYRLQEATDPNFNNVSQVYDGTGLTWTTPVPGKFPGTYYYRVQSYNYFGSGTWSTTQAVTIYPLYVGLNIGWDGNGYVRGTLYYDIGSHETDNLDVLTEPDTIRLNGHLWYDPNPAGLDEDYWTSYYSVVTGLWKGSSSPGDPSWKWGYPWFLPYTLQLSNNKTVTLDNQAFTVTGPFTGMTSWGHSIQYWQLVNQKKFLLWSDGGDWTQYIHIGEAILRFDAGSSRLLLYSNIKRHLYYKGKLQNDTVQYIDNLTSSTSIPGSPTLSAFPEPAFSGQDNLIQTPRPPFESMEPTRR
jgi:hypothetical protein